jgi:hypothetical protein
LLHAAFRNHLAVIPLRFAITSPPSECEEDLHLQAVEHARHTQTGEERSSSLNLDVQNLRRVVELFRSSERARAEFVSCKPRARAKAVLESIKARFSLEARKSEVDETIASLSGPADAEKLNPQVNVAQSNQVVPRSPSRRGLLITWPICVVWAAVAADTYNKQLVNRRSI